MEKKLHLFKEYQKTTISAVRRSILNMKIAVFEVAAKTSLR